MDEFRIEYDQFPQRDGSKEEELTTPEEKKPLSFEEVITPEHLEMISRASGGFSFRPDPSLPPERTGYTNLQSRTIYYNPLLLSGIPELGIDPWKKHDIRGFAYHEAGHHAPETRAFQNNIINHLKEIEIPEAYKGSVSAEERFIGAIWSNLGNTLADIWLESFMGRKPFYPIRESITEFQKGKGEVKDYRGISKPEQLTQFLLRSRYFEEERIEEKLDTEVLASYRRIIKSGAMSALMDRSPFEDYFSSPSQKERCIDKKFRAYVEVFLPEYISLLEKELEERKKQKQKQKKEEQGTGNGEEKSGNAPSEGAPLTREEEEEIIKKIIEELEKSGKNKESQAPSEEERNKKISAMREIKKMLEKKQAHKEGDISKEDEGGKEADQPEEGGERIIELGKGFEFRQKRESRRGLAEQLGVTPEVIRRWERIKERYSSEIISLSSSLADVFLDDRRKKIEYLRREGEIVPGLEYETIAAEVSGETDPQTRMGIIRRKEFLETEIEFIIDTSGSMKGEKINRSIDLTVVITEALKRVRELLSAENLLVPDSEEPLRLGVTKFSNHPKRVTKLVEPINDRKQVNIINEVSQVGGGTEESVGIKRVYQELKTNQRDTIKIICILTDGQGNRSAVEPIIRQIERDKDILFLAVGMGDSKEDADAIVATYVSPLHGKEGNIHGFSAEKPEQALPAVLEFLEREVNKRKR